jgi:hypothetical protein
MPLSQLIAIALMLLFIVGLAAAFIRKGMKIKPDPECNQGTANPGPGGVGGNPTGTW